MTNPDEDLRPHDDREPEGHLEPEERDPEASPEDVVEQVTSAEPTEDEPVHLDTEVNEWDAVEQARVVELGDDY
jgi:hypothetical protein